MKKKCALLILSFFKLAINLFSQEENYADSAVSYYNKSDLKSAISWSIKNVEKNKNAIPSNDSIYGASLSYLGMLQTQIGNYDTAEAILAKSVEKTKNVIGEQNVAYANCIQNLSGLYSATGKYAKAMLLLQNAIAIHKAKADIKSTGYAVALNQMANLDIQMEKYKVADSFVLASLSVLKEVTDDNYIEYANTLTTVGVLSYWQGNMSAMESALKKSIAIYKKHPRERLWDYSTALTNLALIYGSQPLADSLAQEAVAINKRILGDEHPVYAQTLYNLAMIKAERGIQTESQYLLEKTIEIYKNKFGESHPDYPSLVAGLGEMYFIAGDYNKALPILLQSLELEESFGMQSGINYIGTLNLIGNSYQQINKDSLASLYLVKSLKAEKRMLLDKLGFLSQAELLVYVKLRQFYIETYFLPYQFHRESAELRKELYNNHLLFTGIVMENYSNLMKELSQSKDGFISALWDNYKNNKSLLIEQLSLAIPKRMLDTDSLGNLLSLQEKQLFRLSSNYQSFNQQLNISFDDVRHALKPDEACIEFMKAKDQSTLIPNDTTVYTFMLVLPGDSVPILVYPFGEKQLLAAIKTFPYKALKNTRGAQKSTTAPSANVNNEIYKLILQRVDKNILEKNHIKTIYFSPDGLLHQLSFAAIPVNKDSLLCDKYNLVQVTSTRQVAIKESDNSAPSSIALFGGINYNRQQTDTGTTKNADPYSYVYQQNRGAGLDSFHYLPNTLTEVQAIEKDMAAKQKKVAFFTGENATEAAFRNLASGENSPQIIHIATHGFTLPDDTAKNNGGNVFKLSDNPLLRSGLVMAGGNKGWEGKASIDEDDGILTALEISALQFQGTQLVVLSACETGVGELRGSEGVFGLQRAFKLAGVNYIMASLWAVPDKQTSVFMNQFYTNWLGGATIQQAFVATQRNMQKKYPPYFWAGFTLVH